MTTWRDNWNKREGETDGGGQGQIIKVVSKAGELAIVKEQNKNKVGEKTSRARMKFEVDALEQLRYLGADVPKVIEHNTEAFSKTKEPLYIVMQEVIGMNLEKYVAKNGPLSLSKSVNILIGILKTIKIAHSIPLLHRDIKPRNIIIRDVDSHAVLIDFGVAYFGQELQLTDDRGFRNEFMDLPEFRSTSGNKRNGVSDLTHACAILYYCITGFTPGSLRDDRDRPVHRRPGFTVENVIHDASVRLRIERFFDKAFQNDIYDRIQTVEQLELRVAEIKDGENMSDELDLKTLANQSYDEIRRIDSAVRVRECSQSLNSVEVEFSNMVRQIEAEIGSKFSVGAGGITIMNGLSDSELWTGFRYVYNISMHSNTKKIVISITYNAGLSGEECTLYRSIGVFLDGTLARFNGWNPVLRFSYTEKPQVTAIRTDMKKSAAEALTMLVNGLRALNQTKEVP